jgi:hypothetical protein
MQAMKDNPEKLMLFLFPIITLGLFIVAAVLWWLIQAYNQGNLPGFGG